MKELLDKVNQKNEWITQMNLKYSPIGCSIYIALAGVLSIIYSYLKYGHVNTDHLYYPARYVYVSKFNVNKIMYLDSFFFI